MTPTCLHRRHHEQSHRYQQVDFANGGDIRGMIRATSDWLKVANDETKVVVGHGPLAKKSDIAKYNAMVKTARERIEKLFKEGKSEAEVVAAKPLADLDKTWADNEQAAPISSNRSTTRSSGRSGFDTRRELKSRRYRSYPISAGRCKQERAFERCRFALAARRDTRDLVAKTWAGFLASAAVFARIRRG